MSHLKPLDFLAPGEKSKTCIVPNAFKVILSADGPVDIPAGTQELPKAIYEHWYALNNGVTIYGAADTVSEAPVEKPAKKTAKPAPIVLPNEPTPE